MKPLDFKIPEGVTPKRPSRVTDAPDSLIHEIVKAQLPNGWDCLEITTDKKIGVFKDEAEISTVDLGDTKNPFIASGIVNTWIRSRECA